MQSIDMRLKMFDLAANELGWNTAIKIRSYYDTLTSILQDTLRETLRIVTDDKTVNVHYRDSVKELLLALPYGMTEALWWQELYSKFVLREPLDDFELSYLEVQQLRGLLSVLMYDVLYRLNKSTYPNTDISIIRRCLIISDISVVENLESAYKAVQGCMRDVLRKEGFDGLVEVVSDILSSDLPI